MEETQISEEPNKRNDEKVHTTTTKVRQKPLLIYGAIAIVMVLMIGATLYTQGFVTAAKVNGESISRLNVVSELEEQAGAAVLDSMISDILIEQAATDAGVTVTEDEVTTEIAAIESQITAQGGTLEEVLTQQGLDRESLTTQIRTQKMLEALLSSDIEVTEEEINAFLEANGPVPEGQEEAARAQVREQLRSQKFSTAAQSYVTGLRTQANIQYFVDYE
jgi:parvulin-like peptidyl-prolyl isomerase